MTAALAKAVSQGFASSREIYSVDNWRTLSTVPIVLDACWFAVPDEFPLVVEAWWRP